ncbi:hypothetical protein R1flu_021717 [Riccia fluitans]|uniref:G-patch domain-containing protein n=1 Tax=Riccia fluitans TaxID=41844 RepID=A0ABD1ZT74_9MARC
MAGKMETRPAISEATDGKKYDSKLAASPTPDAPDSDIVAMGAETGAPIKFAFAASKPKFSASRPPKFPKGKQHRNSDDESRDMEYVTGFDEQGVVAKDPKGRLGARVIPKLENSWRPEKRMKHIMMETDITDGTGLRFEVEPEKSLGEANPGAKYGLTMGVKRIDTTETTTTVTNAQNLDGQSITHEMTVTQKRIEQTTKLSLSAIEEQRLKQDMALLPNEADLDAYEEMPVENFGEAMLRGMGWEKGKPIGRNNKDVVVPVEYVRRTERTGLGAEAAPREVRTKKYIKPGESRGAAPELVAALGPDGRSRNIVSIDEKLVERKRKGVAKGKVMSIISGRHLGLRGEVLDVLDSDRVSVRLLRSEEKVVVSGADLADIGSLEEEKVLKQIRQLNIGNCEASEGSFQSEHNSYSGREEKKYSGRNDDGRDRDTKYDDGYKAHSRREDDERAKSRKEGRRGERGEYDVQRRSSRGDEIEMDNERTSRSEDRRRSSRDYKREHSRDDARRDSRTDEKRDDERGPSRSYRGRDDADERERVGRDRRDEGRSSQGRTEERSSSADRISSGAQSGGRITESWLRSQIRVRVISKTLNGGRLYLKKGRIVDVISLKECDVLMDESREMIQAVKQDQLETALPKKGGRVMVVGGRDYRGKLGKLIERGTEKGVVQLEETFQIETIDLDHLAEYTADSHELDD